MTIITFHDSWQSSAAWNVRVALVLNGIVHDLRMGEAQFSALNALPTDQLE